MDLVNIVLQRPVRSIGIARDKEIWSAKWKHTPSNSVLGILSEFEDNIFIHPTNWIELHSTTEILYAAINS